MSRADPGYRPPVEGTIVDPFRPPDTPYGPGNRGIDYATEPGAEVVAAAAGVVVFAGNVAGSNHVTVLHPDGLRTSYSFLATVSVTEGRRVASGEEVGTSAGRLHFGVRAGERYLDPAALLGGEAPRVHLVPEPPPGLGGRHREGWALLVDAVAVLGGATGGPWHHYLTELDPSRRLGRVVAGTIVAWSGSRRCTPDTIPAPAMEGRRILVLVGGLGTTSERSSVESVDASGLGYSAEDVLRFSYRGGRTPGRPPAGPLTMVVARPYASADTQGDLVAAARELRLLLSEVAVRAPGVPIDVVAHSQGGVVTQIAATPLPGGPALPAEVDLVATLGSPHDGTDLATAVEAVTSDPAGTEALERLGELLDLGLDPGATSVAQMSETSPLMAVLAASPPPQGIRRLTVAARGDLTVPAVHSRLPGVPHAVVDLVGPDAHTLLPGDPATSRELALARSGWPPRCRDRFDQLADRALPESISWAEDLAGAAAALASGGG